MIEIDKIFKSLRANPARPDFCALIQEVAEQVHRGPVLPDQYVLKMWVGPVLHTGIPIDLYTTNGKTIAALFHLTPQHHPTSHTLGEVSLIDVSSITALSIGITEQTSDLIFSENIYRHSDFGSTPSYAEINNKLALLEIFLGDHLPQARLCIQWSSRRPSNEERFYINSLLSNYEKLVTVSSEKLPDSLERLKSTTFVFNRDSALEIHSGTDSLRLEIGYRAKVGHIYSTLNSYFDNALTSQG